MDTTYRDFVITFYAPPIPIRKWDWHWQHKDFDLDDNRCGHSASLEEAKADIDALYEDQEEGNG